MKRLSLVVLLASSMLFVACGEKPKEVAEVAKDTTVKQVSAAQEEASKAVDAVKEVAKTAQAKTAALAAETKEVTKKATEIAKEKATSLVKAAKAKVADAQEAAVELASKAKAQAAATAAEVQKTVTQAADMVKEKVADAVSDTDLAAGEALYVKCAGCHGKDGKRKALGKSAIIGGQDAAALAESIKGYRAGTRNVSGMGTLMKGQIGAMSDQDIEILSHYISTL